MMPLGGAAGLPPALALQHQQLAMQQYMQQMMTHQAQLAALQQQQMQMAQQHQHQQQQQSQQEEQPTADATDATAPEAVKVEADAGEQQKDEAVAAAAAVKKKEPTASRKGISFMQDPSYPFYRRIVRNGKYIQAHEMDSIVRIQAAGLFSAQLLVDDYYYQRHARQDEQRAALLDDFAGSLRRWEIATIKYENKKQKRAARKAKKAAVAAAATPGKGDDAHEHDTLGALVLKNVNQPRALLQIMHDEAGEAAAAAAAAAAGGDGDGAASGGATEEDEADAKLRAHRAARKRMLAIEHALDVVIAIESIDEGSAVDQSEETRDAECDRLMAALDVFVLPYGSSVKLTRAEVARKDAFFLSAVQSRKGSKLLVRALNVLPLDDAVRVLLFYMRNLLALAQDADDMASDDPNVGAIFGHLVGIIDASERQQIVIAVQTLISFHASADNLHALLATEGGASVVTSLLQRARAIDLPTPGGHDDNLAEHWTEIYNYLAQRVIPILEPMSTAVIVRAALGRAADDDASDDADDAFDTLTPERVWSLAIGLALHASAEQRAAMKQALLPAMQQAQISPSQMPLLQTLNSLLAT